MAQLTPRFSANRAVQTYTEHIICQQQRLTAIVLQTTVQ
jgi:hypothetical protein